MPNYRVIMEYTDIANGYLRSGNWCNSLVVPTTFLADLQACSNANLSPTTIGLARISTTPAVNATNPLVTQIATLNFITTAGGTVQLAIPAPVAAIFGAGGKTVDGAAPLTAALIADVVGFLSDASGNAVATFLQGVASSRRTEQNG